MEVREKISVTLKKNKNKNLKIGRKNSLKTKTKNMKRLDNLKTAL